MALPVRVLLVGVDEAKRRACLLRLESEHAKLEVRVATDRETLLRALEAGDFDLAIVGADWAAEVRTSTSSPFCNSDDKGANLPLILQPTAELPTSV